MSKESACSAGDAGNVGLIPGSGRSPGVGNGNPLQYSCRGEFHGQRILVGYSPRDRKELDATEHTHTLYIVYMADNSQNLKASGVVLIQRPGDLRPQEKLMFQLES